MRFVAVIDADYRVVLTRLSALRWCMQIFGPHSARFDNLYDCEEQAKEDAVLFVTFILARWAIAVPRSLNWVVADD